MAVELFSVALALEAVKVQNPLPWNIRPVKHPGSHILPSPAFPRHQFITLPEWKGKTAAKMEDYN